MHVFKKQFPSATIGKYLQALKMIKSHSKKDFIPAYVLHAIAEYCKINPQFHVVAAELGYLKREGRKYKWDAKEVSDEQAINILNEIRHKMKKYLYPVDRSMPEKVSHAIFKIDANKSFMHLIRERAKNISAEKGAERSKKKDTAILTEAPAFY